MYSATEVTWTGTIKRGQDEEEEEVLQGKAIHGECVPGEQAKEQRTADRPHRDDEAVPIVSQPRRLRERPTKCSRVKRVGIHLGGKARMSGAGMKAVMIIQ